MAETLIPFDAVTYMEGIQSQLKVTKTGYKFARVSGLNDLEEVIENAKRETKFFAVDDSQDGVTYRGAGAGFFERRQYTVFLLHRVKYNNMDGRKVTLDEVRSVFRNILSRLIKDKMTIPVLDVERTNFYEVPPAFAQGCSGIYFFFNVNYPVDLRYDSTEWTS